MTLRQKQSLFVRLIGLFIAEAYRRGYELTFGEAWRTPEQAALNAKAGKGIANSLHLDRLAIDFNLFRDGRYLSSNESWRELGEFWESLHPLCCAGFRFGDGNHLSVTHGGRK